jgi:DNA-binding transcriptional ArsR family regulator
VTVAFDALTDGRRREILDLLLEGEQTVGALADRLPIAQSGVSRHLGILRDAGFVQVRRDGQRRLYSLRPEPFEALDAWLARYRRLWEHRMDAFEAALARRTPLSDRRPAPTETP